jgi:ATP-binding cassette, subfamily B, bacterial
MRLSRSPKSTAAPAAPTPSPATLRRRLSLLIGDRRGMVAGVAVFSLLSGFAEAATLALVAVLAASLVGHSKAGRTHSTLTFLNFHGAPGTLILIGFGLCALRLLIQVPLSLLSARISADVQARLRTELFESFSKSSWSVQSRDREGQLQEVMTGQVLQAVSGATGTIALITAAIQFMVLMVGALVLNAVAAVSVGALSIGMFALLRPLRARGGRYSRELSRAQVAYAGGIAESNRVAEETHVFGADGAQRAKVGRLVRHAQHYFFRAQVLGRLVTNGYQSLVYVLLVAGVGVLYLVGSGHAGSFGAVVLLLLRAGTTGQTVQGSYTTLIQALPFMERTQLALTRYNEHGEHYGETALPVVDEISFERVSFAYNPDTPVLTDVSFDIRSGEAIGVVGPSGAGKSTLVQLLLRLRQPVDGRYLINGVSVAEFANDDWHRQVSYVPQEPRLLHASVAENIRFFRDIDDEQVERAARLARIHDDIMSWPGQYEAVVGPRADAVSGGQQQRICLARALAAQPEVLILDEPTSALDPQSEAFIGASLLAMRSSLTLIIVAHRMSTLEMCDRVMVILDGRLAGFDTKDALQANNDYYRQASQLSMIGNSD